MRLLTDPKATAARLKRAYACTSNDDVCKVYGVRKWDAAAWAREQDERALARQWMAEHEEPAAGAEPTRPGFYWALWVTAAPSTHERDELVLPQTWEIVEVWENFLGDPCEADAAEKFAVSVPGVRETQWLENFKWGERVGGKRP